MSEENQNLHFTWIRHDVMAKVTSSAGSYEYPSYYYETYYGDWRFIASKMDERRDSLDVTLIHFYFGANWSQPFNHPYVPRIAKSIEDADQIIKDFLDYYENCRCGAGIEIFNRALEEIDNCET